MNFVGAFTSRLHMLHPANLKNRAMMGGAVASWLVSANLERALWLRAKAGGFEGVFGQNTLLSQRFSSPRCINGYKPI